MKLSCIFLIFILFFPLGANAYDERHIVALYKQGAYEDACKQGMSQYFQGNKEAHFAAMVGMACARVDLINPLGILQRNLVRTPTLRSTATFFTTLLLAKRLLYQHFVDGTPIEGLVLPKFDHVLTQVFDRMSRGEYERLPGGVIRIETPQRRYLLSIAGSAPQWLFIDEYAGAEMLKRHRYQ